MTIIFHYFRLKFDCVQRRAAPASSWTRCWWSRPTWSWGWWPQTHCSHCWSARCVWTTSLPPSNNVPRVTWSALTASPDCLTVPRVGVPCLRRGTWAWSRWPDYSSSRVATTPWVAPSPTVCHRRRSMSATVHISSSSVHSMVSVHSEDHCQQWCLIWRQITVLLRCQSNPRGHCSTEPNTSSRGISGTSSSSGMTTCSGSWSNMCTAARWGDRRTATCW